MTKQEFEKIVNIETDTQKLYKAILERIKTKVLEQTTDKNCNKELNNVYTK